MERGEEGKVARGVHGERRRGGVLRVVKRREGYFPWKLSILFRPPKNQAPIFNHTP